MSPGEIDFGYSEPFRLLSEEFHGASASGVVSLVRAGSRSRLRRWQSAVHKADFSRLVSMLSNSAGGSPAISGSDPVEACAGELLSG